MRKVSIVDAAEVDAMNAEVDGIIRSNMLAIPARMAGELAGVDEPREVQLALDGAIRKSLAGLEGVSDREYARQNRMVALIPPTAFRGRKHGWGGCTATRNAGV